MAGIRIGKTQRALSRHRPQSGGPRLDWPPRMVREPGRRDRPRVLVVEDDSNFRKLVCESLAADGYEVIEAEDGGGLLERVADVASRDGGGYDPFSAIVTDVRMPGLSGTDAIEVLRGGPWRHTPVVIMTAFADSETTARANRLGVVTVLEKPFDLERLRETMGRVVPPS